MTISLLSLDDRLYDDLVKEFQALIPRYAPDDWTDRNPSDPGIMLVEFLAWLTESQIYRINRVPKDVYLAYFKWLIGDQWKSSSREFEEPLKDARRQALEIFSHPHRLISKEDFERVIIDRFGARDLDPRSSTTCTDTYHASVCSCVERVYCVPERDLSASDPQQEQRGHVSVMLVTRPVTTPVATQELSVGPEYKYQVNPCGNRLVAYGGNQLWTWTAAAPSAPIERLQLPVDAEVTHCAISPDDNAVAVSCNQGAVRGWVWKADGSGQFPLVESGTNMVNKGILSLSLACQNGPLAIQFVDKSVQLCQLWWYAVKEKKWQPLQGRVLEGKAYLRTDGFRMAIQTETSLQLWQLEDNWLAATPDMEIQGRKIVVSESPSHRFAAVISDANELALWDIWRCEKLWTRPYTGTTPDPKFTCDGKRLIVPTNVGDRECWAVATGETLPLDPDLQQKYCPESDDGQRGVTQDEGANKDKKRIRVWNIERSEELAVFELEGDAQFTEKAGFIAGGRYLHTESKKNDVSTLSIWEIGFDAVEKFVEENRQVGCRHHVVGARYVDFWIEATVVVSAGVQPEKLKDTILDSLVEFFDPRSGGPEKQGWPFHRAVIPSEVYQTIHGVEGVDYVLSLALCLRDVHGKRQERQTIEVKQFELVNFQPKRSLLDIRLELRA